MFLSPVQGVLGRGTGQSSVCAVEPVPLCCTEIWTLSELSKDGGDEQGGTLADKGAP